MHNTLLLLRKKGGYVGAVNPIGEPCTLETGSKIQKKFSLAVNQSITVAFPQHHSYKGAYYNRSCYHSKLLRSCR